MHFRNAIAFAPILCHFVAGQATPQASSTISSASASRTATASSTTGSLIALTGTSSPQSNSTANLWLPFIPSATYLASVIGSDVCNTLTSYVINCPTATPASACGVAGNMTYTTGPTFAAFIRDGTQTLTCSRTGMVSAVCQGTLSSAGAIVKTTSTISGTQLSGQAIAVTATPTPTTSGSSSACNAAATGSSSSSGMGAQATGYGPMVGAVLVAAIAAL